MSVTETASETAIFDGGMYLPKPVLFFFFGSSMLYLTCSDACKCFAYITYEAVAEMVENCVCVALPPRRLKPARTFQTPKIFSLSLDGAKSAHHSARLF